MPRQPKIGLLPLYLELYDRSNPGFRTRHEQFLATIVEELGRRGLDVEAASICRVRSEFAAAVGQFEQAECDALVTLPLAYSPSLESGEVLAATYLPIVMLDTTPTEIFSAQTASEEISYNHGIHGVQDLANVLSRLGKVYEIEAGHWERSDVLERVAGWARAAAGAGELCSARVGRVGEPFVGMGDFAVPPDEIEADLGIETIATTPAEIARLMPAPDAPEVAEEMQADLDAFEADGVSEELHRLTTRACLGLRRFVQEQRLTAFSMNFCEITAASGLPCVPFLEASKAMTRGLGYAGEGDVLTAALVRGLASACGHTTFTEMFCPDWRGGTVFLSHMGELNLHLAAGRPVLFEKDWPYTDAGSPVVAVSAFRPGSGVIVNLAPGPDETYKLIVVPGEIVDPGDDRAFGRSVRAWFKPDMPLERMLEAYSLAGGTHHSAMTMGEDRVEDAVRFAAMACLDCVVLGA